MKTNTFRLVAVAASVVVTGGAFAVSIGSTSGALTYANEQVYSAAASMAPITASTTLGFGISPGVTRFIRVDIGNATFAAVASTSFAPTAATPPSIASAPGSGGLSGKIGFQESQLVSGGLSGGSSAIFQVQASWNGGQQLGDVVSFVLPPLVPTSTGSDVTTTYQLFETAGAAVNNAANTALFTATGSLAKFSSGLAVTITPAIVQATVSSAYKQWASAASTAILGTISIGGKSSVYNRAGNAASVTDFINDKGNSLVITGDFTAAVASGVFLGESGACTVNLGIAALNSTSTVAIIPFAASTGSSPFGSSAALCYTVNRSTPILAGTYSAQPSLSFLSSGVTTTQPTAASIGSVTRDGTTLQAPYIQTTHKIRFVLTNTGSTAAPYTAVTTAGPTNSTTDPTNTVTRQIADGVIPANGQAIIETTALPAFSNANSPRGFVVFTVAAPSTAIKGVYQLVHSTTGAISNMPMLLP